MGPNQKPSESVSILATINPVSQGAGTAVSGWASFANHHAMLALLMVGAFGASATVDANLTQAQDLAGTGAKAFSPAKAIAQMLAAGGNNKQALINVRETDLDTNNAFLSVQLNVPVGVAATLISAALIGFFPLFEDAATFNQAGVAQVI